MTAFLFRDQPATAWGSTQARPRRSHLPLRVLVAALGPLLACGALHAADVPKTNAPPVTLPADGKSLFDGKTLAGWKITPFGGHGEIEVKDGQLMLPMGAMLTGVTYTNPLPKIDYEVSLEAQRVNGSDFFCGLTVPVNDSHCSLILGGWGGGVVGISSLDGYDASENETTKFLSFEKGRWYAIRLRVTKAKLEAWVDQDQVVNVALEGRRVSLRSGEIEQSVPFGIATYQTTGALRNIRIRPVTGPVKP